MKYWITRDEDRNLLIHSDKEYDDPKRFYVLYLSHYLEKDLKEYFSGLRTDRHYDLVKEIESKFPPEWCNSDEVRRLLARHFEVGEQ